MNPENRPIPGIALTGLEAYVGPWPNLAAVRQRCLDPTLPAPPEGWRIEGVQAAPGEFRIPPRDLEEMLPQQLLMLQVAARLLRPLQLDATTKRRSGVVIGLGLDPNTTNYYLRWWLKAQGSDWGRPLTPSGALGSLASITASRIAREFGLGGPSFTVSSGPDSGLAALHIAAAMLRSGQLDLALVGAVDFCTDVRRTGGQAADGAIALLLQRAEDAHALGQPVQAILPVELPASRRDVAALGRLGAAEGLIAVALDLTTPTTLPEPAFTVDDGTAQALLAQFSATQTARGEAHGAHLRFADHWQQVYAAQLAAYAALASGGREPPEAASGGSRPPLADSRSPRSETTFDRAACLEFARGSIGRVLGPDFAEVDAFPTRVRLPDEPLMLVHRMEVIAGEKRSLKSARGIAEHDVHPGAWYLDQGRIPAGLAIECGQGDLFLLAWLGIDFHTRGQALYRLLDAEVTLHRALPAPGETARYDISIDSFFRQGETHLLRFHYNATVNGEPLITMRDGCAGFFTPAALDAGQGIVQSERAGPPLPPHDPPDLVPVSSERYDARQLDALRQGDLVGCFGSAFARLPLQQPLRLPGGRLSLLDRVTLLDPQGGRHGRGVIRADLDIDPQAWFLTCHFVDDMVMPGTVMFEGCLQALRLYLMRLGWVAEEGEACFEPVPHVPARLKCRGQVIASTRTATFEIAIKQLGWRPEPFAIADALMYADGKAIVEVTNFSLQLTGMTETKLAELWGQPR